MTITNPEFHDCECGHRWRHGQSGAHDCGPYYRQTIRHLRDAADAAPQVVADERAGGIKELLENSHLQYILKKADEARDANDMGRRARATFEELCEFIFDYRSVAAPVQAPMSVQSAFEKATSGCVFGDASRLDAAQDWFKQGYIAAAPVQVQEPFMYGIMGPDGKAHLDENCVGPDPESLYAELNGLNDDPAAGYSIVKLFTAPVQPVAMPDDCKYQISLPINGESRWYDIPKNGYDMAEPALRRIVYAAPAAQGDAKATTKQVCTNCAGEGRFYKTVMLDFSGGEREETICKVCVGSGVVYSAIAAKAES